MRSALPILWAPRYWRGGLWQRWRLPSILHAAATAKKLHAVAIRSSSAALHGYSSRYSRHRRSSGACKFYNFTMNTLRKGQQATRGHRPEVGSHPIVTACRCAVAALGGAATTISR